MRDYYILWTYVANYTEKLIKVKAFGPEEALKIATDYYAPEFKQKATVYIFDKPPALISRKGVLTIRGRGKPNPQ